MDDPGTQPATRATCAKCGKAIPPLPVEDAYCVRCRYTPEIRVFTPGMSEYEVALEKLSEMPAPEPDMETAEQPGNDHAARLAQGELLKWILDGREKCSTASKYFEQVGKRFFLFAYLNNLPGTPESNNDLAAALEVSAGRASQLVKQADGIRKGTYDTTKQEGTGFTLIKVGGDQNFNGHAAPE